MRYTTFLTSTELVDRIFPRLVDPSSSHPGLGPFEMPAKRNGRKSSYDDLEECGRFWNDMKLLYWYTEP